MDCGLILLNYYKSSNKVETLAASLTYQMAYTKGLSVETKEVVFRNDT